MLNFFTMTHSMYSDNRKQKRIGDSDDLDHIPSTKRLKTNKNSSESETFCSSYPNAVSCSDNPNFPTSHKRDLFQSSAQGPFLGFQNDSYVAQNNSVCVPREEYSILQSNFKYLPDLNAFENPHYYENNKLLFELYVERTQRAFTPHSVSSSQQHPF